MRYLSTLELPDNALVGGLGPLAGGGIGGVDGGGGVRGGGGGGGGGGALVGAVDWSGVFRDVAACGSDLQLLRHLHHRVSSRE